MRRILGPSRSVGTMGLVTAVILAMLLAGITQISGGLSSASNNLGPWVETTPMNVARYGHATAAANGYVYVLGGIGELGDFLATVEYAPVNPDGTLGAWRATTSMNSPRNYFHAVAVDGYLYALDDRFVEYAPINPDGSLGSWATTSALSVSRSEFGVAAGAGHIYVLGGDAGAAPQRSVESAAINADGSLGPWSIICEMQARRRVEAAVAAGSYLYALGGYSPDADWNSVEFAPLNPDGSLGTWTTTSSMGFVPNQAAVSTGDAIYALEGYGARVQRAGINPDGSLTAWTIEPQRLLFSHSPIAAALESGHVYVSGSINGAPDARVEFAGFPTSPTLYTPTATSMPTITATPWPTSTPWPTATPAAWVHRFFGSVTIDGTPAPAGAEVIGVVGGATCGQTTVQADSTYTLDVSAVYGCATQGATVSFTVAGYGAEETATWSSGQVTELDLTVLTAAGTATPWPTATPYPTATPAPFSGVIPARASSVTVHDERVSASRHISVTLTSDPGRSTCWFGRCFGVGTPPAVSWIEPRVGQGFVVHLTGPVGRDTTFTYRIE